MRPRKPAIKVEPHLELKAPQEFDSVEWLVGGGEMGDAVRAFDWSGTSLRARTSWPSCLRFALGLCLNSRFPMFLWWGPDLINIYNDGYAPLLGHRHPSALGQSAPQTWKDLWPALQSQVDAVFQRGQASWNERVLLVTNRKGYEEEAYFTFSYSPAFDEASRVAGLVCVVSEETAHVLAERRQAFLVEISDLLRRLNKPGEIVSAAVDALGKHLKVNRAGYGNVQSDDQTIVLESSYANGVEPLTGSFPLNSFGPENIARQRQGITVVYNDVADDDSNHADTWASIETRSFVSVPLVHEGRFRASLYVTQREVRFWLPEEITLIEDVAGRVWEAVERARIERQLREAEERLRLIIDDVPGLVSYMDNDLRYQFANRVYSEWFGQSGEALVGKTVREIIGTEAFERVRPFLERALNGEPVRFEQFLHYGNGPGRHVHISYMPRHGKGGSVQGIVSMVQDITEHKTTEQAVLRSNKELREANGDLEQFAYSASHDLKEPLRMVAIYSQMLKRKYQGRLDAQADEYLKITLDGARRMEALVADLLAYLRAVSPTDEDVSPVAADTVLDQALSNLSSAVKESGVTINRVPLPRLRVQAIHLVQLFQNLIGNAIKYRGPQPPVIHINAERQGSLWTLYVHDNGIGIQPEYHQHVFGIFKRLHTADTYAGTGMGLAICQKIVHRYGGRIWVESKGTGQGSSFCLTLPGEE